jgi:hypothetical protein
VRPNVDEWSLLTDFVADLKANVLAAELKSTEKELDRLLEDNHRLRNEVAADKQV